MLFDKFRFIICSGNKIALLCLEIKWVVLRLENPIIPLSIVNFLNYKIVLFEHVDLQIHGCNNLY